MVSKPTQQAYAELQKAYDFFNQELFDNRLPYCLITLQRQHDTYGYFSANQFQNRTDGEQTHEIALNPSYFAVRTIQETLSVLVREMVSLDQRLNTKRDKLPRRRYRNTEWADMCEAIGLMPTDTGLPGGKRVGDNVQTYVIEGGPFDQACSKLVDDTFTLSWVDRFPPRLPLPVVASPDIIEASPLAKNPLLASASDDDDVSSASDIAPLARVANSDAEGEGGTSMADLGIESMPAGNEANDAGAAQAPAPQLAAKPAAPPMKRFEPVLVDTLKEQGIEPRDPAKSASKTTFQCSVCGAKAWGKPSLRIGCYGAPDNPHEPQMMGALQKELPKTA
ncbi:MULTISPECIES: hypothetical protein [Ectopseudomonas]|uniref:Uncharacterized protein n=2 Tax=Ectopseudomonas TaxID=3236654 RepID=A0A1G6PT89_9GAMM|nr:MULTISPECIES: hypothetical protein [Pseudomonas]ALN21952.1 hypothetical protein DW68_025065 [Pseudomonas mendocina S5.2]MBP3061891.1 hypothetical protein [Pseudomonas chengduensis]NNB75183.1 hypothetical protein [Pseudomonas chengduensis]OEO24577.1 hypothetical protein AX279_18095 [Pseudomonas sp. J237]SDC82585.1 hypothetical protein SAMN05216576_10754 [Pseudomonas chengduensis]